MKIIKYIIVLLFGISLGMFIETSLQMIEDTPYPPIKVEQLDSLRQVYRVNIEVNDIYLHGEIYKIKTSD
jgi:uncharacterized protein YneF (UPF0154 family)